MLLQSDPSLAEVPGFSQEQLDRLARSVESRRQQLESDIQDYIRAKQHELRSYERQLVEQHRSMECVENTASAESNPATRADNPAVPHAARDHSSPDVERSESQERVKRTKHGKVKKREQELYGLVTPAFLPLLDARDSSPTSQKEKKSPKTERTEDTNVAIGAEQTGATRHAEKSKDRKPKKDHKEMEGVNAIDHARPTSQAESHKKTKRLSIKKSALRHKDTPRSRRKRVSLVIDGQTVLPADTVVEPPLTSPSSEATSTSNSTASLDELIDPRLTRPDFTHNAVHHSLPMPMANTHSPSKPLAETPSSLVIQADHSPPLTSPSIPFAPPSAATRTFLDPSPSQPNNQPPSIPRTAGPDPIYPNTASTDQLENSDLVANDESENENWGTYVGGLHGSGVDDVDQAGSYGYPSSLGASYLESYMQSRPLSVRMQAKDSRNGRDRPESEDEVGHGGRRYAEDSDEEEDDLVFGRNGGSAGVRRGEDEDMDITGSMEF